MEFDSTGIQTARDMDQADPLAGFREKFSMEDNLMIYLDGNTPGGIAGSPRQVLSQVDLNAPLISIGKALGWEPLPLTIEEGRHFSNRTTFNNASPSRTHWISRHDEPPYLIAANLTVLYDQKPVLKDLDLGLFKGQITVLMGPNELARLHCCVL